MNTIDEFKILNGMHKSSFLCVCAFPNGSTVGFTCNICRLSSLACYFPLETAALFFDVQGRPVNGTIALKEAEANMMDGEGECDGDDVWCMAVAMVAKY